MYIFEYAHNTRDDQANVGNIHLHLDRTLVLRPSRIDHIHMPC